MKFFKKLGQSLQYYITDENGFVLLNVNIAPNCENITFNKNNHMEGDRKEICLLEHPKIYEELTKNQMSIELQSFYSKKQNILKTLFNLF